MIVRSGEVKEIYPPSEVFVLIEFPRRRRYIFSMKDIMQGSSIPEDLREEIIQRYGLLLMSHLHPCSQCYASRYFVFSRDGYTLYATYRFFVFA